MKILRNRIFLSILNGIFFVIYRQSDEKGFRRWWLSFQLAALIAAILAGLIPNPVEASETYFTKCDIICFYKKIQSKIDFSRIIRIINRYIY